jgi:hypothetical protein
VVISGFCGIDLRETRQAKPPSSLAKKIHTPRPRQVSDLASLDREKLSADASTMQ